MPGRQEIRFGVELHSVMFGIQRLPNLLFSWKSDAAFQTRAAFRGGFFSLSNVTEANGDHQLSNYCN